MNENEAPTPVKFSNNSSMLIGDVRWSEVENKLSGAGKEKIYRTAESFFFELSELMKEYGVVKVDVCIDAYAYAEKVSKETLQQ